MLPELPRPYQPKLSLFPRKNKAPSLEVFKKDWYDIYHWSECSKSLDLAFCFFCRFFGSNDTGHKGHVDSAFTEK
jgi:hypothetical protein